MASNQPTSLKTLKIALAVFTVAGFVPWEEILHMQIVDQKLFDVYSYFGFISLFALMIIMLITALIFDSRYKRFKVLSYAMGFLLIGAAFRAGLSDSPEWTDQVIYKSNNDYLILQELDYGIIPDHGQWRLIETRYLERKIRNIAVLQKLADFNNRQQWLKGPPTINYADKIWTKQPNRYDQ